MFLTFLASMCLLIGIVVALPLGLRLMFSTPDGGIHLACRDSAGWRRVNGPAGVLQEVEMSSSGDLWVETDSPKGLARWSGGQWTQFGGSHYPSDGFAVSGKQAWVTRPNGIERFDGQHWQMLPVNIPEPMALTAEGNDVWILNAAGLLAHCAGDDCETHSVANRIQDSDWSYLGRKYSGRSLRHRRLGYGSLIKAPGRLWFIHEAAWYSPDGLQWTQWQGSSKQRVWPLGYSGGRLWMKTWNDLVAVGDDLQGTRFPLDPLTAPFVRSIAVASGQLFIAGGTDGLFEHSSGASRPVVLDAALGADNVSSVAATPEGIACITGARAPRSSSLYPLYAFAGAILLALLVWNVVANRRARRVGRYVVFNVGGSSGNDNA
jgi:hypothetical protein